jgi:simple sugar transport system ATP-binding protein
MSTVPLIDARGIVRRFGHVQALKGADFNIFRGEIVALLGDNGAGKSTLVRILSGTDLPTEGEIRVDGKLVRFAGPQDARALGIETVYQDLALAPDLDTAANVFLGREIFKPGILGRLGVLDKTRMRQQAGEALQRLGVAIRPTANVIALSGGQRQTVAVARAAMWAKNVIFMDEPTAALGVVQTKNVLDLIRRVKAAGTAVVLISHNLPQVLEVADRIVVLRLGQTVAQVQATTTSVDDLVRAMTAGLPQSPSPSLQAGV